MKVLIIGAGIAGPALAYWLTKLGHKVTIVERAPVLRDGGQQIDIREEAVEVVRRMGLLPKIQEQVVQEAGLQFIGLDGKQKAFFPKREGNKSFTSEYEIMRGDLCRVMYEATRDLVEYRFGTSVDDFADKEDGVLVTFADKTQEKFDLMVAADGQESRTRKKLLGEEANQQARRNLNLAGCYYNLERAEPGSQIATVYNAPDRRVISTRWHEPTKGQVYFLTMSELDKIKPCLKQDIPTQKRVFAEIWKDAGWESASLIQAMQEATDFYALELVQICSPTWSSGRVVLLGDAAHAPSGLTGMGTSLALMGSYVLGGEISRHEGSLMQALKSYEDSFKPYVEEVQTLPRGVPSVAYPKSEFMIKATYGLISLASFLQVDRLFDLAASKKRRWTLPPPPIDAEKI